MVEAPEDRGIDLSVMSRRIDERPYLVVRLVRRTPANVLPGALAFALPFARIGAHVSIFYDRIEVLSGTVDTASYVILGHTIAHEIGHVLLGSSAHAASGLMQAQWNPTVWYLASVGRLGFHAEEAERMSVRLERSRAGPVVVSRISPSLPGQ